MNGPCLHLQRKLPQLTLICIFEGCGHFSNPKQNRRWPSLWPVLDIESPSLQTGRQTSLHLPILSQRKSRWLRICQRESLETRVRNLQSLWSGILYSVVGFFKVVDVGVLPTVWEWRRGCHIWPCLARNPLKTSADTSHLFPLIRSQFGFLLKTPGLDSAFIKIAQTLLLGDLVDELAILLGELNLLTPVSAWMLFINFGDAAPFNEVLQDVDGKASE